VPELTDELIQKIGDQSDAQSGHLSIRELERLRDNNLVSILRALKGRDAAAGALLNTHQQSMGGDPDSFDGPIITIRRSIPIDWTDYNGHMNESRYGQVFSDAADTIMRMIGADKAYIDGGLSYFTVDIRIKFLDETHAGDRIFVKSRVLQGQGKKLRLYHEMCAEDGHVLATGEQMLIHVSLETRKSCESSSTVAQNVQAIAAAHADLPWPDGVEA